MKSCPDGDHAVRIAPRRASLHQHIVASPDAVDEVIAGVPCRVDQFLERCVK